MATDINSPAFQRMKQFLKNEEGCEPGVYKCSSGYNTVGIGLNMDGSGARKTWQTAFGSLDDPNFSQVKKGEVQLTETQIDQLFAVTAGEREVELAKEYGEYWQKFSEDERSAILSAYFTNPHEIVNGKSNFKKEMIAYGETGDRTHLLNAAWELGCNTKSNPNRRPREAALLLGEYTPYDKKDDTKRYKKEGEKATALKERLEQRGLIAKGAPDPWQEKAPEENPEITTNRKHEETPADQNNIAQQFEAYLTSKGMVGFRGKSKDQIEAAIEKGAIHYHGEIDGKTAAISFVKNDSGSYNVLQRINKGGLKQIGTFAPTEEESPSAAMDEKMLKALTQYASGAVETGGNNPQNLPKNPQNAHQRHNGIA